MLPAENGSDGSDKQDIVTHQSGSDVKMDQGESSATDTADVAADLNYSAKQDQGIKPTITISSNEEEDEKIVKDDQMDIDVDEAEDDEASEKSTDSDEEEDIKDDDYVESSNSQKKKSKFNVVFDVFCSW
jgi:hypothetical protein